MLPEDARTAETRSWLTKAREDLRAAKVDLEAEPPLLADAAFHTQQACEKALKGFLTWHGRTLRKTHNLVELGEGCAAIDPSLETMLRQAAPLTEYAWRFRYPGDFEEPSASDVEAALSLAHAVVEATAGRILR